MATVRRHGCEVLQSSLVLPSVSNLDELAFALILCTQYHSRSFGENPIGADMQANITGGGSVETTPFGVTAQGSPIERWRLGNGAGLSVAILTYGGIVQSMEVPDR